VRHKVTAFEQFLERYPAFQGQVVLIQVALSTTEQNELQASITDVISHVNSRFGSLTYQPVVLLHTQDITFSMYLGLLTAADAFIVTSLREGMALRTHEYVECQSERKRPLLLSEVRLFVRVCSERLTYFVFSCS
jgi:trehalose 6-phosphate synthase complex regulatory subunit